MKWSGGWLRTRTKERTTRQRIGLGLGLGLGLGNEQPQSTVKHNVYQVGKEGMRRTVWGSEERREKVREGAGKRKGEGEKKGKVDHKRKVDNKRTTERVTKEMEEARQ
eukprot:4169036-Pleurochrysis_carterae.AAC.2